MLLKPQSLSERIRHQIPLATLLLIAPFFLWGTAMVAMKGVIPQTTPLFMAGVRLVPAGVLVLLFAALTGRSQPKGWLAWLWISLFALVDGVMFQGFLAEGLVRTDAGLGSVMIDSQPLAVALLSLWLFKEQIGLVGWLGLAVGVLGISLIGLPDAWILDLVQKGTFSASVNLQHLFENGEWLMLLAAMSMAVGTIIARHLCKYTDPVVATGWHMILGGLPLFAVGSDGKPSHEPYRSGWMASVGVFYRVWQRDRLWFIFLLCCEGQFDEFKFSDIPDARICPVIW
jgi:drug/metabolite transporter (DMT)-like permease